MKILCLYNNKIAIELFDWLNDIGHETVLWSDLLNACWCEKQKFDLTISYTYRFIITSEVIRALNNNIVNLHNSFLPFNRGADPNIWSIIDETPRGVTLHYIDIGLDTGDIIAQAIAPGYAEDDTLASTYATLDYIAKVLFKEVFEYYPFWNEMRKRVYGVGTYHKNADANAIKAAIQDKGMYDIKVSDFQALLKKLL